MLINSQYSSGGYGMNRTKKKAKRTAEVVKTLGMERVKEMHKSKRGGLIPPQAIINGKKYRESPKHKGRLEENSWY